MGELEKEGCSHYQRSVLLVSPCCGQVSTLLFPVDQDCTVLQVFPCRFCHDEAVAAQVCRTALSNTLTVLRRLTGQTRARRPRCTTRWTGGRWWRWSAGGAGPASRPPPPAQATPTHIWPGLVMDPEVKTDRPRPPGQGCESVVQCWGAAPCSGPPTTA